MIDVRYEIKRLNFSVSAGGQVALQLQVGKTTKEFDL